MAPGTRLGVPWLWPLAALFAVSALLLGIHIAGELIEGEGFGFDIPILLALRVPGHLDTPVGPVWLTQSAIDLTALGGFTLMWLFGASGIAFLVYLGRRAEAAWIAAALIGSSLISTLLKGLISRPRPALVPHLAWVDNASFPSGHAMISAATYLTLALMLCETYTARGVRVAIVAFFSLLVVLIGCSRVYLGVHWPSDVLGGWCFGTVWAAAMFAANRALKRRIV
ncbi:phosphatase PAP2 family protein [Sphingomonas immobilis]|uniref:Phosphatase PAP2 family protein n=1 Tax=Sphingomonas immobilis TaxID=3063997 RepID=A0ABT8ZYG7_9SPHN|nr:phosphatase PAP2 family protein [Sphingomonas sp. CA1-15]MDO7842623.1 phosphatase PAP2 family protein [Sphingomonas sp. CA1-15]